MSKPYLFSPSEFAFGYSGCKRCYYDLKVNDVRINFGFPSIFSKIDSIQKKFYHNKPSKFLNSNKMPEGIEVYLPFFFNDMSDLTSLLSDYKFVRSDDLNEEIIPEVYNLIVKSKQQIDLDRLNRKISKIMPSARVFSKSWSRNSL